MQIEDGRGRTVMSDGFVRPPNGASHLEARGLEILVLSDAKDHSYASTFLLDIPPGYDVGAHVHRKVEETFFVIEGEVDLMAFAPVDRTASDWQSWEGDEGQKYVRAAPGTIMVAPPGCPHAFRNPGPSRARLLFQASPPGQEDYFAELMDILRTGDDPDPERIADLRRRYEIEQLTPVSLSP